MWPRRRALPSWPLELGTARASRICASGEPRSERTSVVVRRRRGLSRGVNVELGVGQHARAERPRLRDPGGKAAVEDPRRFEAVDLERPPGASRVQADRVVVQHDRAAIADARARHERHDRSAGASRSEWPVSSDGALVELSSPVEVRGAGQVTGIEHRCAGPVRAPPDVDDLNVRPAQLVGQPLGRSEQLRTREPGHDARVCLRPAVGGPVPNIIGSWSHRSCRRGQAGRGSRSPAVALGGEPAEHRLGGPAARRDRQCDGRA